MTAPAARIDPAGCSGESRPGGCPGAEAGAGLYAFGMSSDPIADLGRTVGRFAGTSLHCSVLTTGRSRGTPAGSEADGEPFAGDWGAQAAREVLATVAVASASCADYLTVIGMTLQARSGVYSL
jgi:hypothetical protein